MLHLLSLTSPTFRLIGVEKKRFQDLNVPPELGMVSYGGWGGGIGPSELLFNFIYKASVTINCLKVLWINPELDPQTSNSGVNRRKP